MEMRELRRELKRKAVEFPNERVSKLVCTEAVKKTSVKMKDVDSLSRQVRRDRLKARGHLLPKSRLEAIHVLQDQDTKPFLIRSDEESEIVLITTRENVEFSSSSDHILADGTFTFCPAQFCQLYTFHGSQNGHFVPCVFCLLPD